MDSTKKREAGGFRFIDFLVILLCLSGAAYCINLFRIDLFSTIGSRDAKPIGTITIKSNVVQRRVVDRVLWDRLFIESPVYLGDLIRVADHSSATLHIESNDIDLEENTLIRIIGTEDGDGSFRIELGQGSLILSTGADGRNFTLSFMDRRVEVSPGTVLNAAAAEEDGVVLQVSQGAATFVEEDGGRELSAGMMIVLDGGGAERTVSAAAVMRPLPNARFLKNAAEPFPVSFAWNRINLAPEESLRLEIAEDRNFTQIFRSIDGLNSGAQAALDAGLWHWRLSRGDEVLAKGQFTITEAAAPRLMSPASDSLYRYQSDLPALRFQWTETEGAFSYLLEVSQTPEFTNPRISRTTEAAFLVDSSLEQGTWYWRVLPFFPPPYQGGAAFSPPSFFRIERGGADEVVIALPEPEPEPKQVSLSLLSPSAGESIPGLTALRQQTVFQWEADGETENARFVLSRNSNPLEGRPQAEIANPGRTVRIQSLDEGTWYWTVEAQSSDGIVSSAEPRQLRVLPIPLLPVPLSRLPSAGYRFGIEELRANDSIVFSWAAVQGANAYIFTLFEEISGRRRQILQRPPENSTRWTLDNIGLLGQGTFVWQIEAVNRGQGGRIEQRGRTGENSFSIDIPPSGPVQIEEPGILYGN